MGMATYIEQSVNNALDHYVMTSSDAVIAVLTPVAVPAVTLYVMWTGFQVMRGDVQEPVTALVWRWFRVALITGLTLNRPQYPATSLNRSYTIPMPTRIQDHSSSFHAGRGLQKRA